MKKNARADITINTTVRRLKTLAKKCDINDPEQVKTVLATETNWQNSTKENIANSYTNYLIFLGKTWKKPKYKRQSKIPYIPTEQELDALINASRKRMATFLQFLKETGARSGEATNLQWIDIDPQRKMVYIRAEKNSNDRLLPVSEQLLTMLNQLPKTSERVFKSQVKSMRKTFEKIRNRTAVTLANPKLKEIHFHTFRHWKATTYMHSVHDAWEVKSVLGHKSIKSTEIYIHIDQMTSNYSKQWSSLVTHNLEEETKAIDTGYELVRTINETTAIYRKRK